MKIKFLFLLHITLFYSCSNTKSIEGIWKEIGGDEGYLAVKGNMAEVSGDSNIGIKMKKDKVTFYYGVSFLTIFNSPFKSSYNVLKNTSDSLILLKIPSKSKKVYLLRDSVVYSKSDSILYKEFMKLYRASDSAYYKGKERDWFKFEKPE